MFLRWNDFRGIIDSLICRGKINDVGWKWLFFGMTALNKNRRVSEGKDVSGLVFIWLPYSTLPVEWAILNWTILKINLNLRRSIVIMRKNGS
jgi:hypothetical protein